MVTGVAGFIGSNLSEKLLKENYSIIGVDNFDDFYDRKIKEKNISVFSNNPKFKFFELDICKNINLLNKEKFDFVIHLAAKAGVLNSITDIETYIHNNIIGTKNVLELMRKVDCNKMIFSSSSSVYGNTTKKSFSENDNTDFPLSPYATSKKSCELMIYNYHNNYNINSIILRLFSVYGKNQRPDLLFSKFSDRIRLDKTIEIYGEGNSMRDYTEVSDIVDSILLSISFLRKNKKVYSIFNIGTSSPTPISEVKDFLYKSFQKEPKIRYLTSHKGDMILTCADITKARLILGYDPKINFEKGITKFCKWYKEK